jgi:hypothetical protein
LDQGRTSQGRGGAVLGSVLLLNNQLLLFYTICQQDNSLVSGKVTNWRRTFQTWSVKNTDALRYSEPHRAFFLKFEKFYREIREIRRVKGIKSKNLVKNEREK